MKWVITGILAVSAAAALANGYTILSNDDSEAPAGMTVPSEAMGEAGYLTFSYNTGGSPVAVDQSKERSDKRTPAARSAHAMSRRSVARSG